MTTKTSNFPELPLYSLWVEETLAKMNLEQKIGQVLHPCIQPSASESERVELLSGIEVGGLFLFSGTREEFSQTTTWFQNQANIPLIVSSDLEHGAGRMVHDASVFPGMMALAASNDETLAYEMGRATAIEGRALGVHWAFAPVVDVNVNPFNPGTNTMSMGDDPQRIARLSKAIIRGMQEHNLSACVKHFPGGGLDDRDQHICNTINPLQMQQWFALSGHPFQEAINQGVWSIMIGHISLPAWDIGDGSHIQTSPPATLSRRILTKLLREKMGFQGVIITDAMDMGGVTAFGKQEEIVPAAIEAGCDMILFSNVKDDFIAIQKALETGKLSETRLDESVRRILALKEVLGLNETVSVPAVNKNETQNFQNIAENIAERAVTLVRDTNNVLPLKLEKGMKVLSYHLRGDASEHVDTFDELLLAQGLDVSRFDERDIGQFHKKDGFEAYDVIIISAVFTASWGTNRIRPAGNYMRDVWAIINSHHEKMILVSYGSPYLGYDMPHLPCVLNAYSPDLMMQKAVLGVLTGDLKAIGTSPVKLDAPYTLKYLEGLRYSQ